MVGTVAAVNLLLALHVLCMSAPATVPLLAVWFEFREGRGDWLAGELGRRLLAAALWLFLIGALLGLLIGWLQWERGLADALARLAGRVRYGVLELVFSSLLMLGHWFWWRSVPNVTKVWRGVRSLMGILAGTNLLYHFPVLFAVVTHLIHQRESMGEVIHAAEFRQYLADPAVTSRVVHILLAYLAAGGVAIIAIVNWLPVPRPAARDEGADGAARVSEISPSPSSDTNFKNDFQSSSESSRELPKSGEESETQRRRFTASGAQFAILPTVAQIPTGLWVFTQLSPMAQGRLLGGDLAAGLLLVLGIATAFWLLHLLASLCLGEHNPRLCRRATLVFVLTMILMTLSSRRVMASVTVTHLEATAASGWVVVSTTAAGMLTRESFGTSSPEEGMIPCPNLRTS
jgi:hypothetical protein